eukprot:5150991-Lingulodinium_polyedra.AAC.1
MSTTRRAPNYHQSITTSIHTPSTQNTPNHHTINPSIRNTSTYEPINPHASLHGPINPQTFNP